MKIFIFNWILVAMMLLPCSVVYAQSSVNSGGGNITGIGGTAAYSIGQVVYTVNSSSNAIVEQGVQHAYDVYTVDVTDQIPDIPVRVFPNPVSGNLNLELNTTENRMLDYYFYDMNGSLILHNKIDGPLTGIQTSGLAPAAYYLEIREKSDKVASFKIIKH